VETVDETEEEMDEEVAQPEPEPKPATPPLGRMTRASKAFVPRESTARYRMSTDFSSIIDQKAQ
jgi:hypothetical protein